MDDSQPGRDWDGRDLAAMLGIKPRNMFTQLGQWTCGGFLVKTGRGRYALPEPSSQPVTAPAGPYPRQDRMRLTHTGRA